MPCPKCRTRVVVPKAGEQRPPTRFESRGVESSLAMLDPVPGGVFADPGFSMPDMPPEPCEPTIRVGDGMTLPPWAVYALVAGVLVLSGLSFLAGLFLGRRLPGE